MGNKKRVCVLVIIALMTIVIFSSVESQSFVVASTSVFSTFEQTEIQMYVLMNTLGKIDEEKLVEKIISEHQKINGVRGNTVYTLNLYRTLLHYRGNWKYDTITCNENGAIICCGEDLGV